MTEEEEYIAILERTELPLDHPLIKSLEGDMIKHGCRSCGKQWVDHSGIAAICAENARLRTVMINAMETYHRYGCDGKAGAKAILVLRQEIGIDY